MLELDMLRSPIRKRESVDRVSDQDGVSSALDAVLVDYEHRGWVDSEVVV